MNFVFNCAITYVPGISITCKFSSLSSLSFSVVLSNWKSKPKPLCLGLNELFSEDVQTPSSPQVTFHTSIFLPFVLFYLLCHLWTVDPNSTIAGAANLFPMQNTSPGNWCFPETGMISQPSFHKILLVSWLTSIQFYWRSYKVLCLRNTYWHRQISNKGHWVLIRFLI